MPERTSVATDAAGRRVMAKVAGNAVESARLDREAAQLDAARHPGVVELVGVDGHGVGAMLLTAHVEGPPLARVGPLPPEEGAGLLAALATTLADLHQLGLVHGAVSPDHVIVGPGGRPVLCGFAYGGAAGQPAPPAPAPSPFLDPSRAGAIELSPAFDVYALGALARFLAPDAPAGHILAKVAQEAMSDDASSRPSARALAGVLQHEVPSARLPRGLDDTPMIRSRPAPDPLAALRPAPGGFGAARPRRLPRPAALMVAVAAAGLVAAAFFLARASSPPRPRGVVELGAPTSLPEAFPPQEHQPGPTTTRAGLASTSISTSTSAVGTTFPGSTAPLRRGDCTPATAVLQADVDGDGCPDALRYVDGVLQAGDVRWSLGQAGDQVATGDWACQGARTLALFRPATGEVFRFDGWAVPGRDVTATVVARVQDGQALRAGDVDRDGCHELVVERATGAAEVIRVRWRQP